MLNRQKALIELLRTARRPVLVTELTKWAFLLRAETASTGGSAFYDFVPYRFGPFSFALYHELRKLEREGWLTVRSSGRRSEVSLCSPAEDCQLKDITVADDISHVIAEFGDLGHGELFDRVYEAHPSYTVNSEVRRLAKRPIAPLAVYTAGYEGRSVDSFLGLLVESGIRHLIDVRRNPIARRYGFHKSTLCRLCNNLDIDYTHLPMLGIASEQRRGLDRSEYKPLFDNYERETLVEEADAVAKAAALVTRKPSVLVCMEACPQECHRSRLATKMAALTGLSVRNLGYEDGSD